MVSKLPGTHLKSGFEKNNTDALGPL